MMKKMFKVTEEYIHGFARCEDPINNPVALAIKQQVFPHAADIVVQGEDVLVDGEMWTLCIAGIRFLNKWNLGRRVDEQYLFITS
jgi:hypothetical protein